MDTLISSLRPFVSDVFCATAPKAISKATANIQTRFSLTIPPGAYLVRFFGGRSIVRRINLLRGMRHDRWRLKFSRLFPSHSGRHEVHPDGQRSVSPRFLRSQGLLLVVANPDTASHRRRKSYKPCVGEVVGGPGLAAHRERQLRRGDSGTMQNDLAE